MMASACVAWCLLVASAGCGRINFDATDTVADGGDDGSVVPPSGNCAFATSSIQSFVGLGSLAGADAVCEARAIEGRLDGRFVAWVSTTGAGAPTRLAGARGWYRVDGYPIVDTVADLVAGRLLHPISTDERGDPIATDLDMPIFAATGTFQGVANANCADFTSSGDDVRVGLPPLTANGWSTRTTTPCTQPTRLYCFQLDHDEPLVVTPATGRTAFLSTGTVVPASGRATADALCASEASSAGLVGTFLALLPGAEPAASRFDTNGAPWVRIDGIALADTADQFLAGAGRAPLNLTLAGGYEESYVLTGLDHRDAFDAADPARTCNNWMNAGGLTAVAIAAGAGAQGFYDTTTDCMTPRPVYCLQM